MVRQNFASCQKLVLPVSKPFLATLALFSAVGQWNSWLDSAYYVRDNNLRTLSYKMMTTINSDISDYCKHRCSRADVAGKYSNYIYSSGNCYGGFQCFQSCVYIHFWQKLFFVQGMMIGAVKE